MSSLHQRPHWEAGQTGSARRAVSDDANGGTMPFAPETGVPEARSPSWLGALATGDARRERHGHRLCQGNRRRARAQARLPRFFDSAAGAMSRISRPKRSSTIGDFPFLSASGDSIEVSRKTFRAPVEPAGGGLGAANARSRTAVLFVRRLFRCRGLMEGCQGSGWAPRMNNASCKPASTPASAIATA